jgi:uncharacterized protein Veg
MKKDFIAEIRGGELFYSNLDEYKDFMANNEGLKVKITLNTNRQRTIKQNNSLHQWFDLYYRLLKEQGQTLTYSFGKGDNPYVFERFYTAEDVKNIFKIPMKLITGKTSTAKLTTKEVLECEESFVQIMQKLCDEVIPFPNKEELLTQKPDANNNL